MERMCRRLVLKRLKGLRGVIRIEDTCGSKILGSQSDITAHIVVHHMSFYSDLVLRGSLGAATSWMEEAWDSPDLTTVFALFARNPQLTDDFDNGWARLSSWIARILHARRLNSRLGSQRNIADHYDLGNELFSLFLDSGLNYSSAVFNSCDDSLEQAARNKLERVCTKLALRPGMHILEIGCGWGGFIVHAAREHGCRVTGITISQKQYEYTQARVIHEGLADQVEVLLCDYRDHRGAYDRVVSIEMIEAVGHEFLGTFFEHASKLTRDDGLLLLQAIAMPDQRYADYLKNCDFIQRYIFPGSCIPSLSAMIDAMRNQTDLKLVHLEDIGSHYARTLRTWRDAFNACRTDIVALGYSERFIRLWQYYFCYCEAGFSERYLSDLQIVMARPDWRGTVGCDALPILES